MTVENNPLIVALKSLATANPIGSAIVTAIGEYVPSAHDRAIRKFAESIRDRVDELGDRLDSDYVRREQFADLYKNCLFISQRTQYDEKLRAAANILTNALLADDDEEKLPYDLLDLFARCIENLSIGAIHVLGKTIGYCEGQNRPGHVRRPVDRKNVDVEFRKLISLMPEGFDRDHLMGLIGELSGYNLLHSRGEPGVVTEGDKYATYPFQTTPLGYKFVKYVLEPGCSPP